MKHTTTLSTVALVAALGFSLTACGGSAQSSGPTSPSVEAITPAASATPTAAESKRSPRGNLIKEIGQPAGMFNPENEKQTVNFTFNSITVDAPCTGSYPSPAENGHLTVVDVTAETTEELGLAKLSSSHFDVSPAGFTFIGANGTTFNGSLGTMGSFSCLADAEEFPMNGMGPAEKVRGKVVLDLPEKTGTLVFKDLYGQAGWEYKF